MIVPAGPSIEVVQKLIHCLATDRHNFLLLDSRHSFSLRAHARLRLSRNIVGERGHFYWKLDLMAALFIGLNFFLVHKVILNALLFLWQKD